ncbi:P-loop containing nucleoside triphosphate hydrolase protein [Aspergillus avenaceus]|uniref:P-loop containing nucleoside triphosphate hydrolase protein n=1 Tax=Aspergillus avenaceus TaxID=36643 RepID=A0A5N6TWE2_ASPAV|nr:P-loop containing nucleoside triphosphate hydrolase protein [Aspergillus avenaceus]
MVTHELAMDTYEDLPHSCDFSEDDKDFSNDRLCSIDSANEDTPDGTIDQGTSSEVIDHDAYNTVTTNPCDEGNSTDDDESRSISSTDSMYFLKTWKLSLEVRHLEKVMDRVMCLVGQEQVKEHFLQAKARLEARKVRKENSTARLNIIIKGNAGRGKSTVARLYAELLRCFGFSQGPCPEMPGYQRQYIRYGIQIIYKASWLTNNGLDTEKFLDELDEYGEDVVTILVNPTDEFYNTSGRWRFERIALEDFTDAELRQILVRKLKQQQLLVEGGFESHALSMLAQRVGQKREGSNYLNTWGLDLEMEQVMRRHAVRLSLSSVQGLTARRRRFQYRFLSQEDLIPKPIDSLDGSVAWKQIQAMVGIDHVKKSIDGLLYRLQANYHRELQGKPPIEITMNQVILGPPGTGKTTIAKLFGQVTIDLGLLPQGEVVIKNPSDFLGQQMGESETKAKQILDATHGKVLIIDDAHMLFQSTGDNIMALDTYHRAIIDTLVANIHNQPSDNRCVILIGYPDEMEELFRQSNPGLRRRFPLEDAIRFHDYELDHLMQILDLNLARGQITATDTAKQVAAAVLTRARDRPNFGNGGDVENLLRKAKSAFHVRTNILNSGEANICLEPEDFDQDYNRDARAGQACENLFSKLVGMDKVKIQLRSYSKIASGMRLRGIDPRAHLPFTFVFRGPPGTGKTTTARIVGEIFYEIGFLSTTEVIECSARDLIGQWLGQTAPKVRAMMERALGKVLFIDEAYRLSDESHNNSYHQEAVGELVDSLTKPRFARKLVVVLAGYDHEMDQLLHTNPGLRSRFPTDIVFPSMSPRNCFKYLRQRLREVHIRLRCPPGEPNAEKTIIDCFSQLSTTDSWASARDVETLINTLMGRVFEGPISSTEGTLNLPWDTLVGVLNDMLRQRKRIH